MPTVLIVDDNRVNRTLLADVLAPEGHQVSMAENGREALEAVRAHRPDLILLDIMMPEMDGREALRRLKADEATAGIPVMMVTSVGGDSPAECLTEGACDYVVKPFSPAEVRARVRAALSGAALAESEVRLKQANLELARANQELEQFAYVASHDLKQPLRMIASYCQLLQEDYEGRLDEDADRYIHFAVAGAQRMQRLIDDLLHYSRVGGDNEPLVEVELDEIARHVLENLAVTIEECEAEVAVDPLPTVNGNPTQLSQLLQNLVANGLKFRGSETPRVEVKVHEAAEMWIVQVIDNGIGIDPKSHERIFRLFQRLHTEREYPGTGIGLTMCKKIVERHGGEIWVESEIGLGTTFCFTLPVVGHDRGVTQAESTVVSG